MLGLDPDPGALWPGADAAAEGLPADSSPAQRAAAAVLAHCRALIDAAASACVAVKPQLACFERLGAPGRDALGAVVEHARERGLLVIADGKRGDIDVTARAYSDALLGGLDTPFGAVPGLGADLVTVNPLMGRDAITPFVSAARARGAGVLALVRTSNPGAADVQDLELGGGATSELGGTGDRELAGGGNPEPAGGAKVWERLAALVAELGAPGIGAAGLSDVGAVVGATAPRHLARARELMPHAILLLPGVGAQGGRVEDLAPAFAPGRAGGLIAAARAIVGAHLVAGGDPAAAARAAAERLRAAAWGLS